MSLFAGVAQLVEQLTCNQQVGGPNPLAGSRNNKGLWNFPQTLFVAVSSLLPYQFLTVSLFRLTWQIRSFYSTSISIVVLDLSSFGTFILRSPLLSFALMPEESASSRRIVLLMDTQRLSLWI